MFGEIDSAEQESVKKPVKKHKISGKGKKTKKHGKKKLHAKKKIASKKS